MLRLSISSTLAIPDADARHLVELGADPLAQRRRHHLAVVDAARKLHPIQDHRRRHHGSSQRRAPGLVHAGKRLGIGFSILKQGGIASTLSRPLQRRQPPHALNCG
jgi:hypothetical protein